MCKKIVKWLFFFSFTWILNAQAIAPNSIYQIEIIIYSHINEAGLRSEYWAPAVSTTIPENALELSDEAVEDTQWLLGFIEPILKRNNNTLLLHTAWQLSTIDAQKGIIMHIEGGDNYGNDLQQLDGFLSIRLDRYFNLNFNLRFLLPWEDVPDLNITNLPKDPENPYITFTFDKKLRMRSNELNYIDHPLYGIFIKIVPLNPPSNS